MACLTPSAVAAQIGGAGTGRPAKGGADHHDDRDDGNEDQQPRSGEDEFAFAGQARPEALEFGPQGSGLV